MRVPATKIWLISVTADDFDECDMEVKYVKLKWMAVGGTLRGRKQQWGTRQFPSHLFSLPSSIYFLEQFSPSHGHSVQSCTASTGMKFMA